jgi:hypothetical protein
MGNFSLASFSYLLKADRDLESCVAEQRAKKSDVLFVKKMNRLPLFSRFSRRYFMIPSRQSRDPLAVLNTCVADQLCRWMRGCHASKPESNELNTTFQFDQRVKAVEDRLKGRVVLHPAEFMFTLIGSAYAVGIACGDVMSTWKSHRPRLVSTPSDRTG